MNRSNVGAGIVGAMMLATVASAQMASPSMRRRAFAALNPQPTVEEVAEAQLTEFDRAQLAKAETKRLRKMARRAGNRAVVG